jgi:carboxypeptidase Taq
VYNAIMQFSESLERLHSLDRELILLGNAGAVLHWDMETYMPRDAVEERAEQMALLEGIAHGKFVAQETGELLERLGSTELNPGGDESLPDLERDFLRTVRRSYDKEAKLPADFVSESARAGGLSQAAWAQARKAGDFAAFLPHLKAMIGIAREKARLWGWGPGGARGGSLYDGLLDDFEPGMREASISALFTPLRERLSALLRKAQDLGPPDASFLKQDFPLDGQETFCNELLDLLGFDRGRGRMDASAHPFTTSLGPNDVRITTRYFKDNLLSSIFSTAHEFGHAYYGMGFPDELRGTCLAEGASMAIHESQSRFWENAVGRSLPFWDGMLPKLESFFPEALSGVSAEQFYRASCEAKPSLIRVDADEVSYGLHIALRFELEQGLVSGKTDPARLPELWREKTRELFGIDVDPSGPRADADGVLQDIHWSMGAFGYFPSYALGNLYGAQFYKKLKSDVPGFAGLVAAGNFAPVKDWLRENVWAWGCRLEPARLLEKATGEKLGAQAFLDYLGEKYGAA